MATLNYLPVFEDDVLAIWGHIAKDNLTAADEFVDELYARCLLLIDHPLGGPARSDIAKGCRHLRFGRYLILYRYARGQIDLVRALDGPARSAARCSEKRCHNEVHSLPACSGTYGATLRARFLRSLRSLSLAPSIPILSSRIISTVVPPVAWYRQDHRTYPEWRTELAASAWPATSSRPKAHVHGFPLPSCHVRPVGA